MLVWTRASYPKSVKKEGRGDYLLYWFYLKNMAKSAPKKKSQTKGLKNVKVFTKIVRSLILVYK